MMSRELIRRAAVALQHAVEARTVEFQVKHADEARRAFEQALRSTQIRKDAAACKPSEAARLIAQRAVAFEIEELKQFEQRLSEVEERIASAIQAKTDPRDFRRIRLCE